MRRARHTAVDRAQHGVGLLLILVFSIYSAPGLIAFLSIVSAYNEPWWRTAAKIILVGGIFLISTAMLICAASSRPVVKWPLFALVAVSCFFMESYRHAAGNFMEYADWIVLWEARANAPDALHEYFRSSIYPLVSIPVLLLAFLLIRGQLRIRWAASLFALSVLTFVGVCILRQGSATSVFPFPTALYGLMAAQLFDNPADAYVYDTDERPTHATVPLNVIMIIDESVRYDFFHFAVLPELAPRQGAWQVHDFGLATSMSNCSAPSNIMLRKGARIGTVRHDVYHHPLIWSYAHNAGYQTWLLDAQRNGVGHDYFDERERSMIDHRPEVRSDHDVNILNAMQYLNSDHKTFSLIIKQGAHFPYAIHYPATYHSQSTAAKKPYVAGNAKRTEYVNAISYQTEKFLAKLLDSDIRQPTMVIYTSDHGQNIDDWPGLYHCNASIDPHMDEGAVPLLVMTNYPAHGIKHAATINQNKLSHFNILPTILDAMGYDTSQRYPPPSATMQTPQAGEPGFLYGSLFGHFGSRIAIMPVDRAAYLANIQARWAGN